MKEKCEAEKAAKLAGVAYWAKDKHMMNVSLRKVGSAGSSGSVNLYQTKFIARIQKIADREHDNLVSKKEHSLNISPCIW